MSEPTTTSFAILSLLAVQPWTTYGLAQQMERSLGTMWPRATSVVYEEPKRLVKRGLATAEKRLTGNRASTVYSITDEGRRALAGWLAEPGDPPNVEHEALLKVAFADYGSLDGLRVNLAAIQAHAKAELAYSEERSREYAETTGPYPDRLPIIALVDRYFAERNKAMLRWAEWAEHETANWTGVTPTTGATTPADAFQEYTT